ncbi:LPXTG cell wall anchor domain-containing protein [Kitasatospora sp. NPDC006697]|uniref:LPXTG cell wall anchor domain-containing protein n=1 Tax=Kitasatospora sp. NPDC006697 TaxID=3364020 RepID=UPI0036B74147
MDDATNSRGITGGPLVPGGQPVEFTVRIANPGPHAVVLFPTLVLGPIGGSTLDLAQQKVEIQYPGQPWFSAAAQPGSGDSDATYLLTPAQSFKDNWLIAMPGGYDEVKVRISVTADVKVPGVAFAGVLAPGWTLNDQYNPTARVSSSNFGFLDIRSSAPSSPAATVSSPPPTFSLPSSVASAAAAAQAAVPTPAPAAVAAAKAADKSVPGTGATASHTAGAGLAYTGGGSDSTPIALAGAAAIALGAGTLVVLRRRRKGSHA